MKELTSYYGFDELTNFHWSNMRMHLDIDIIGYIAPKYKDEFTMERWF